MKATIFTRHFKEAAAAAAAILILGSCSDKKWQAEGTAMVDGIP